MPQSMVFCGITNIQHNQHQLRNVIAKEKVQIFYITRLHHAKIMEGHISPIRMSTPQPSNQSIAEYNENLSTTSKKRTNMIAELSPLANIFNKKTQLLSRTIDNDSTFYGFPNEPDEKMGDKSMTNFLELSMSTIHNTLNTRLSNIETKFTELESTINDSTTGIRKSLEVLERKIDTELRAKTTNTEMDILIRDIETKLAIHESKTKQQMEKLGNTIIGLSEFKQTTQQIIDTIIEDSNPFNGTNTNTPAIVTDRTKTMNPFVDQHPIHTNEVKESSSVKEMYSSPINERIDISEEREQINQKKLNFIVHNLVESESPMKDIEKVERMIKECLMVTVQIKEGKNSTVDTHKQCIVIRSTIGTNLDCLGVDTTMNIITYST